MMLLILIQKEILHHILSVQFVVLLLMCLLLIPLTLSINYGNYRQHLSTIKKPSNLQTLKKPYYS